MGGKFDYKSIFGIPTEDQKSYASPERLADVMSLIQVLALDKNVDRSEKGMVEALNGPPRSLKTWYEVARMHPEFFRANEKSKFGIVLVARHVLPKNEEGLRRFDPNFVGTLLQTAIDMHDRQVRRTEKWVYLVPIWVALVAGIAALIIELIKSICRA